MTIFIHGFGSNGKGNKAEIFRKYFKEICEPFIAPSLSYIPELAISTLEELIESYNGKVKLIGSSLGGFYALYLSKKYNLKTILINPSINPQITLKRFSSKRAESFYDKSFFDWNEEHIDSLNKFKIDDTIPFEKIICLVQKGDELLDPNEAINFLKGSRLIIEEGGNHSFVGIERYFETIFEFFNLNGLKFKHSTNLAKYNIEENDLAYEISNLYYDYLANFFGSLRLKIKMDAIADKQRGRILLSNALFDASAKLESIKESFEKAWKYSRKETNNWMMVNGYNKIPKFDKNDLLDDVGNNSLKMKKIVDKQKISINGKGYKNIEQKLNYFGWNILIENIYGFDVKKESLSFEIQDTYCLENRWNAYRIFAYKGKICFIIDYFQNDYVVEKIKEEKVVNNIALVDIYAFEGLREYINETILVSLL
jgi:predicted esterase YcpF (UPF0227 family)